MKQFGTKRYHETVHEIFNHHKDIWDALVDFLGPTTEESFRFLEAYYTGEARELIYDLIFNSTKENSASDSGESDDEYNVLLGAAENNINIPEDVEKNIKQAYHAVPFNQKRWDTALKAATNQIAIMLEGQPLFTAFWKSPEFWDIHIQNGGRPDDIRELARRDAFIQAYSQSGLTAQVRAEGEELIKLEGNNMTLASLVQRLEEEHLLIRDPLKDAVAASQSLGVDNPIPIQRFAQHYMDPSVEWRDLLRLAQDPIQTLGFLGTSDEFIDWLVTEGFLPKNRPSAQDESQDGSNGDPSNGGEGNGGGGNAGDGRGNDGPGDPPGGGDNGGDDRFSGFSRTSLDDIIDRDLPPDAEDGDDDNDEEQSGGTRSSVGSAERTLSMDVDDFLNNDPDEIRRAQAGGHAGAQTDQPVQDQNGEPPPLPPRPAPDRTTPVGNTPLLQLIRDARHLHGTQVVNTEMRNVRDALIDRNLGAAQTAARALASALLGGPRAEPHLQNLFEREVRQVVVTILAEINGALSEDEKKPRKQAPGNDGPDPGNTPRRGPDGGNPGAGSANGAPRKGGANAGGQQTSPQGEDIYNRETMDRMERERILAAPKDNLATIAQTEIREISKMLATKQIEEAKQRAVALSRRLLGNGGAVPEMSAETILKLAHAKVATLRGGSPVASPAATIGGLGEVDDDDPGITVDPATAAKLVPVTDWKAFCGVYQIEEKEIKTIKALALKAVWEPKDALTGCKSIISRRKGQEKDQVKIKNEKYLARALVHAVHMKAAKKKLKKPMKATGTVDL